MARSTTKPAGRKSVWNRLGNGLLYAALFALGLYFLWFGIAGHPFVFGRGTGNDRTSAFMTQLAEGNHPFSADNLLWYPIAGVVLSALLFLLPIRWKRPVLSLVIGSLVVFVPSLITLVVALIWMASGREFSNYLPFQGDVPFLGTIITLSLLTLVGGAASLLSIRFLIRSKK